MTAFDQLREMINHPKESADANIDELLVNLTGLTSSYLPQEKKASLTETVTLSAGQGSSVIMPKFDFERAQEAGHYLCAIEYDLIHDIERQGRNVLEVFRTLCMYGEIVDCEVNFEAAGTLDGPIGNQLPVRLIFSDRVQAGRAVALFPLQPEQNQTAFRAFRKSACSSSSTDARTTASRARASGSRRTGAGHRSQPEIRQQLARLLHSSPTACPRPRLSLRFRPLRPPSPAPRPLPPPPSSVVEDSIRVNVATLEMLMNLAGELVLGRNQLRASIAQKNPRALKAADQRINQITSELQDVVMQTRLQPIGNVFGKFPRLVRDLASNLHKDIQLDIRGKDVALDRSLIESLSDPLTHMVRNAVDHGIESPEDRVRAGKGRQGMLSIDARHEAGQVVVEIADDGKGIDPERIAKVALSKGLITAEKLDAMSAKDKTALIFLPGLSTNTK